MSRPLQEPVGLQVARVAKLLSRAFDDALAEAGGSMPTWLILLSLKRERWGNQRELAEAVGIQGATLTHHLDGLEASGLISRRRDPGNRRVHIVELTDKGDAAFHRLRKAATAFDRRLRAGIAEPEVDELRGRLERLAANAEAA